MDLFAVAANGDVWATSWNSVDGWEGHGWVTLGVIDAQPARGVAAVARDKDHLDIFATGTDGRVYSMYRAGQDPWSDWILLDQGLLSAPIGRITALSRSATSIDLFVQVEMDQVVYSNSWDAVAGWTSWFRVDNSFLPGAATICAVARTPANLDLFMPGRDGGVFSTYWSEPGGWAGNWFRIDDAFNYPCSDVSAVSRSAASLDLFVPVGAVSAVSSAYWNPDHGALLRASITFHTHDDDKDSASEVFVFIKNRMSNTRTPQTATDYVEHLFEWDRYQPGGDLSIGKKNPYIARGRFLGAGAQFGIGEWDSLATFQLELASDLIDVNDVLLPEVSVCLVTDPAGIGTGDTWIFDYTVKLSFDIGDFIFSSTDTGPRGIILDQDNPNHCGIGRENDLRTEAAPATSALVSDAVLQRIQVIFHTHAGDDRNKNADTHLTVRVTDRRSESHFVDLALGSDLFPGDEFPDDEDNLLSRIRVAEWTAVDNTLTSRSIRLADIKLPMIVVAIIPDGYDSWTFDYQVTLDFGIPEEIPYAGLRKPWRYVWRRDGIILDQDNRKHVGIYQGPPLPTAPLPTAPRLTFRPVDRTGDDAKSISIASLNSQFDYYLNNRFVAEHGPPNPLAPLFKIAVSSAKVRSWSPVPNAGVPETVLEFQTQINGDDGATRYVSSPSNLRPLHYVKLLDLVDVAIFDLESNLLSLNCYPWRPNPLDLGIAFFGGASLYLTVPGQPFDRITLNTFAIEISMSLAARELPNAAGVDAVSVVDLFSWLPGGADANVRINLITDSAASPDDELKSVMRDRITGKLAETDPFTRWTLRDRINAQLTTWLLGGVPDDVQNIDDNNTKLDRISVVQPTDQDPSGSIRIEYRGPRNVFVPQPPAGWPPLDAFTPSTLANIDHIVVLTKENRSFDHVFGYLSLPADRGGMGRADVDGLKGGESNFYKGKEFGIFPLAGTRFVPGPPNGYESVHHAINGGTMDGFVRSHADLNNDAVAGDVMGYHTGATLPVYDALARDFAIGHRWFSSHPGPTYPNRFWQLTGRPNLDARGFWEFENSSPRRAQFTKTIFDYLNGAVDPKTGQPVTWCYFEDGPCTLRFYERHTFDAMNIVEMSDSEKGFFARAAAGTLPSVSFIDPHFVDLPPGSTCDEPPGDMADGQTLAERIVEAVIRGPAWNRTLLLIVYDEHGGFFDHVPPPSAAKISEDFPIGTFGVRVPAIVVSPWVRAQSVFGGVNDAKPFDHTSILKTIVRRFLPDNPPYLGARYAAANDLSSVIGNELRTPEFPPFIRHRIEHVHSKRALRSDGGDVTMGAPDSSLAQAFAFEEALGGSFYIRSHASRRYLTAVGRPSHAKEIAVIEADKYAPAGAGEPGQPDSQRWLMHRTREATGPSLYTIACEGHAGFYLHLGHAKEGAAKPVLLPLSRTRLAHWTIDSVPAV